MQCFALTKERYPFIFKDERQIELPPPFRELIPGVLKSKFTHRVMSQLEVIYGEIPTGNKKRHLIETLDIELWRSFSDNIEKQDFHIFVQSRHDLLVSILSNGKRYQDNHIFNDKEMINLNILLEVFQLLMFSYSVFYFIDQKSFDYLVIKKFILGTLLSGFCEDVKLKNLSIILIFNRKLIKNVINLRLYSDIDITFIAPIVDNIFLLIETLLNILVTFKRSQGSSYGKSNKTSFRIQEQRRLMIPKTFTKELDKVVKPIAKHIKILKMFVYSYMKVLKKLQWDKIFKIIGNDKLLGTKLKKRRQYILSNLLLLHDLDLISYFRLIDSKGCF